MSDTASGGAGRVETGGHPTGGARVFAADLTWTGEAFEPDVQVAVGADGRIGSIGRLGLPVDVRLERRALLPGFVNAHSHAFQRGLRGSGESFPGGAGSFWTWREAMYELVDRLDGEVFREITERAFREMRRAGITTVGEFHYLHHSPAGADWAFDDLVMDAADAAGIRLVLLEAYYRQGGIGRELEGGQRRFRTADPAVYWERMDRLAERARGGGCTLGAVAHSIRAATPDEIGELHREAKRRGWVMHLHVEEQRREIEECLAAFGRTPMATLLDALDDASGLTAIHCTHTTNDDLERFLAAGGRVGVCPLTEANLGDGLPDLAPVTSPDVVCLGTDSNARISMLEEMRWLEYGQRLRRERRGVLTGAHGRVAPRLLAAATSAGAAALGVDAGRLAAGCWADMVAVDLDHPSLDGWHPTTLLESLVFGAGDDVIAESWVGGR